MKLGASTVNPITRHRARGAMLLEVIIALGLLVFGMVMIGLQINAGLDAARHTNLRTRAIMLADTKLSELQAGFVEIDPMDEEVKGDFGITYPGFTWRITLEESTDIDELYKVRMEIGYNEDQVEDQIDDPDYLIDFEDDGRRTLYTVYRLWPKPPEVDPETDYGINEEQREMFFGSLAGAMAGGDLENLSGGAAGPDLEAMGEALNDIMLSFMETGTFDFRLLSELSAEEFEIVAGVLEALYGRGGADSLQELSDLLSSSFGQLQNQGGPGGEDGGPGENGPPGSGEPSDGEGPPDGGDLPRRDGEGGRPARPNR